jgi:hypothetical protein
MLFQVTPGTDDPVLEARDWCAASAGETSYVETASDKVVLRNFELNAGRLSARRSCDDQ